MARSKSKKKRKQHLRDVKFKHRSERKKAAARERSR
jgi:hypothetical protein